MFGLRDTKPLKIESFIWVFSERSDGSGPDFPPRLDLFFQFFAVLEIVNQLAFENLMFSLIPLKGYHFFENFISTHPSLFIYLSIIPRTFT